MVPHEDSFWHRGTFKETDRKMAFCGDIFGDRVLVGDTCLCNFQLVRVESLLGR